MWTTLNQRAVYLRTTANWLVWFCKHFWEIIELNYVLKYTVHFWLSTNNFHPLYIRKQVWHHSEMDCPLFTIQTMSNPKIMLLLLNILFNLLQIHDITQVKQVMSAFHVQESTFWQIKCSSCTVYIMFYFSSKTIRPIFLMTPDSKKRK